MNMNCRKRPGLRAVLGLTLVALLCAASAARAERVKDIASVAGVRSNQLIGYGLVVGLAGTGDRTSQAEFTIQSIRNMLTQFGVTLPPNANPRLRNVAAVMVTTKLGPFVKNGQNIDVTVSSIANADSLRGGTLLMTPLRGADGRVYAIAQGNLIVGGIKAGGDSGSSIQINIPSVARIPNGATVERTVASPFHLGNTVTLNLHRPDFTTARRVSEAINAVMGPGTAMPLDAASIEVRAPEGTGERVSFVSMVQNLNVEPADAPARVVINSRTGTVVIGSHVTVTAAAVAQGNLTVTISENPQVSQPGAFAGGQTAIVPRTQVQIEQEKSSMFVFDPGVSLDQIVRAVNEVGATPSDLVAILQALHEAGALRAELIVI